MADESIKQMIKEFMKKANFNWLMIALGVALGWYLLFPKLAPLVYLFIFVAVYCFIYFLSKTSIALRKHKETSSTKAYLKKVDEQINSNNNKRNQERIDFALTFYSTLTTEQINIIFNIFRFGKQSPNCNNRWIVSDLDFVSKHISSIQWMYNSFDWEEPKPFTIQEMNNNKIITIDPYLYDILEKKFKEEK